MKSAGRALAAPALIIFAALSLSDGAAAACPHLDPQRCENGSSSKAAPIPKSPKATATLAAPSPTPNVTPTSIKVPLTNTPIPPTSTPALTSTPTTSVQVKPLPARSADGTFYITDPGVYSGNVTCGNIGSTAHCVHIWESQGVTLQDFAITTAQGAGLQLDNNTIVKRGTIKAPNGAATGWHKVNVTIDAVTFDSPIGGLGFLGGSCENLTPRPNRQITVRNSSFVNQSGDEMLYIKCGQDIVIEDNQFAPGSAWGVSTPDGLNITIRRNTFDLRSESLNWLAIELPRVIGADVTSNSVLGPSGDWFIYVNSGTNDLVVTDNCVAEGIGVLHSGHQAGGVAALTNERNGLC